MSSRANNAEEAIEVGGFVQIAVGVQLVGFANVFFGTGCRQNGDGDQAQARVQFDLAKDFAGIGFGEVEIEEDEAGRRSIAVDAFAAQELKGLVAIGDYVDLNRWLKRAQGFLHEADVGRIVFDDEDISTVEHALIILSRGRFARYFADMPA